MQHRPHCFRRRLYWQKAARSQCLTWFYHVDITEKRLGYSRLVCLELWEQSFSGGLHRGWITLIQCHSAPVAQTWDISYWVYDKTQLIYFCLLTEEFSWPPCVLCILCALCALVETGVTKLSLYLLAMVYINWVCQFKCQELGSALSGGGREGGSKGERDRQMEGRRKKAHESAVQDYVLLHLKQSLLVKLASTAPSSSIMAP